jgi:hypothetical protein
LCEFPCKLHICVNFHANYIFVWISMQITYLWKFFIPKITRFWIFWNTEKIIPLQLLILSISKITYFQLYPFSNIQNKIHLIPFQAPIKSRTTNSLTNSHKSPHCYLILICHKFCFVSTFHLGSWISFLSVFVVAKCV